MFRDIQSVVARKGPEEVRTGGAKECSVNVYRQNIGSLGRNISKE